MLAMKSACERCSATLAPDQRGAFICSYECTFCSECTEMHLSKTCPNCSGQLLPRPTRENPSTHQGES